MDCNKRGQGRSASLLALLLAVPLHVSHVTPSFYGTCRAIYNANKKFDNDLCSILYRYAQPNRKYSVMSMKRQNNTTINVGTAQQSSRQTKQVGASAHHEEVSA